MPAKHFTGPPLHEAWCPTAALLVTLASPSVHWSACHHSSIGGRVRRRAVVLHIRCARPPAEHAGGLAAAARDTGYWQATTAMLSQPSRADMHITTDGRSQPLSVVDRGRLTDGRSQLCSGPSRGGVLPRQCLQWAALGERLERERFRSGPMGRSVKRARCSDGLSFWPMVLSMDGVPALLVAAAPCCSVVPRLVDVCAGQSLCSLS